MSYAVPLAGLSAQRPMSFSRPSSSRAWVGHRAASRSHAPTEPTALNAVLELNGLYETNGDNELLLSPGIQYVTQRWILEATVQLPVWQETGTLAKLKALRKEVFNQ